MNDLEKELKKALDKAKQFTFEEYCKTCYQDRRFCDGCRLDSGQGEPEMYLSGRDMWLQCELEAMNDQGEINVYTRK